MNFPPVGNDWKVWAGDVSRRLSASWSQISALLSGASASIDGVLFWDRSAKAPVVSKDGAWRPLMVGDVVFVAGIGDLPDAVAGVITLADYVTYFITGTVDLAGARLVGGRSTVIIGGSSENCRIKSTGLTGVALITSEWSLPIREIALEAEILFDLDASGNANQALDWHGVNFVSDVVGTIANYDNFVAESLAFLDAGGLILDGTFGTIGLSGTLFSGATTGTIITVPATATITRRMRVSYSAITVPAGTTGINISASASLPVEGFILDTVNFTGAGTYLGGLTYTSDKALFLHNRGVTNTSVVTGYYAQNNATATAIASTAVKYKAAGTTAAMDISQKFTVSTTNRATYTGAIPRNFMASGCVSLTSGNNNDVSVFFAKNGTAIDASAVTVTTSASGRVDAAGFQILIDLDKNDYIEVFVQNTTATNAVTLEDISVILNSVGI